MKTFRKSALAALTFAAMLAACGESPDALLASAQSYLDKSDPKAAVIQLKTALQEKPDWPQARYLLGRALLDSGDPASAALELQKARELGHPDAQVVPLLAGAWTLLGEDDKLIREFADTRLEAAEGRAALHTALAGAYGRKGRREDAEASLRAALEAVPDHPPAVIVQARLLAGHRDFDGAMALLDGLLAKAPEDREAWLFKGDLAWRVRADAKAALEAYRKAVQIKPSDPMARTGVVTVLLAARDVDGAAAEVAELKKLAPTNPQTQLLEAQIALERKDYKLAKDLTQQLLKLAPEAPDVLQVAAAAELGAGSPIQAEALLAKALKVAPYRRPPRLLLAQTYMRLGEPAKAVEVLAPMLQPESTDAQALAMAAEAHVQAGDIARAQAEFARAAKINPDDVRSRTALALTRLAKDPEGALADLRQIAANDKGSTANLVLVSVHMRRGERDRALQQIDQIEAKQPNTPMPHLLRGNVQLAARHPDAARKHFEKALAVDPAYLPAATALARLDLQAGQPQAAAKRYEDMLRAEPNDARLVLALAAVRERGDAEPKEVQELLNRAVKLDPAAAAPRLKLVDHLIATKQNAAALTTAQEAAAALPDSLDVLDALGRAQLAAGEMQQAISTFGKLVQLQPKSALGHVRLADAHIAAKDPAAAVASLKRALTLTPDLLPVQNRLFLLEMQAGRPQEALAIARDVQAKRPADGLGHLLEADVEVSRKNWDAAATAYRAAMKTGGASRAAMGYYAMLNKSGREPEAERFARDWLGQHPKDAGFLFYFAEVAFARKDYAVSEANYRKVLEVQPGNVAALNNVAWILAQTRKPGAVALAEKANQLKPNVPAVMETLAVALAAENQLDRAIEMQKKVVAAAPEVDAFRLSLAKLYLQAGQKPLAKTELERLSQAGARFAGQAEVAQLLQGL